MVEIVLRARLGDDLNWGEALAQAEGKEVLWILDLGIEANEFNFEDEMAFQACSLALKHFAELCLLPGVRGVVLYRGPMNLSEADTLAAWLRLAASVLPEDLPLFLSFNVEALSRTEALALASPGRFEHFELILTPEVRQRGKNPALGVCMPQEGFVQEMEQVLQRLDTEEKSYRIVYEAVLTEQWDGLDEILVLENSLSPRGERNLKGFLAAGGTVKRIGAEGFEPPAYWSQTSRASQTALCPEVE